MTRTPAPRHIEITPENKCGFCPGSKCCTYITQKIPGPRSMADFDHLLWQLAHRGVQAYRDSDGWYLLITHPCNFLQPDGRCGIYATRPQLCRDYTNDFCEFDQPAEEGFDLYFPDYASLDAYCRQRFRRWDARFG
ncbi:Fe-S-cluster oxidoreductase [Thiohalobacter thiocyanaticus]|uniref:Fe-S-cluster oxidoreductase n=1 Tax=Thiohalobacter thiocyanaticus TaxID=585455 RepID=A0A1Z4VNI1_9GAMM|nr:YkgJ family cysteine cluster protein [Thiohalobacter thiocyanaticus]BAZ93180.1 Fe-S-cluster oxidoreductase [Thiohalobacter thiocyanaticus]